MTTTHHHLEKDMPLERLINFLCRYAWFKKTAYFLGRCVCALAWGLPLLAMTALVIFLVYKVAEMLAKFATALSTVQF